VVYFGLGISHAKGKPANQIWLLAEAVPSVLHNKLFTRYILKDEVTGNNHPDHSGIMFADLEKLSEENSQAGELAALFLGKSLDPQDETVKKIAAAIKASFQEFKEDKEVVEMFTFRERWERDAAARARVEGRGEGRTEGRTEGVLNTADRVLDLLKNGVAPTEIEAFLLSMKNEYGGKKEAALS